MLAHFRGNSVGAVNDALAIGHFVFAVYENRALAAQLFHHKAVVNDLFAHVDGRAKRLQRDADYINGPDYTRAEPPRLQQK